MFLFSFIRVYSRSFAALRGLFYGSASTLDYRQLAGQRADRAAVVRDSLYRRQSAGERILHLQAAEVRDLDLYFRVHHSVGEHDRDRNANPRAGLDVVLAGNDVGP